MKNPAGDENKKINRKKCLPRLGHQNRTETDKVLLELIRLHLIERHTKGKPMTPILMGSGRRAHLIIIKKR